MEKKVKCTNIGACTRAGKIFVWKDEEAEFVCPECGEPLVEVKDEEDSKQKANGLSKQKRNLIIMVCTIVLIIVAIIFAVVSIKKQNAAKAEAARIATIEQARQDSIAQAQADSIAAIRLQEEQAAEAARLEEEANAAAEQARLAEEEAKTAKKVAASTSGSVDYGKWSGAWKAGKPHGTGTMKYTQRHLIDSRDPQKRTASPGDYIIGEFANGKLVQGVWYDSSNNVKGSIIIGM
ncbi:MAG: hypothetical protein KBT27_01945 [Prevotellaceae bacterium]|nr:hypothetical protein [Candidatus Faecinaster equi]